MNTAGDASPTLPERAYVALGSNVGDRAAHLAYARDRLAALPATRLLGASSVEATEPLPGSGGEAYLNQMVLLETTLSPAQLLAACLAIEAERGRERSARARWAPRTLDLDIVRYGTRSLRDPGLTLPHPELPRRDFWQREIAEIEAHVHA